MWEQGGLVLALGSILKKEKPEHHSPNPDARVAQLDANRAKVPGMAARGLMGRVRGLDRGF